MQYIIEVDDKMNDILIRNAAKQNIPVQSLIADLLKRYLIDKHIMEQDQMWQDGINELADVNLDWANL